MTPLTFCGLHNIALMIGEADDRKGYGSGLRLDCFIYVTNRITQEALHGQHTQIGAPFEEMTAAEIMGPTLITAYFASATACKLREKDARHASEIRAVNARCDRMLGVIGCSGRIVTSSESSVPAGKKEVSLNWVRSSSMCYDPCSNKHRRTPQQRYIPQRGFLCYHLICRSFYL
jgi:hypothetical protein